MRERHRLHRLIAHPRVLRREIIPHARRRRVAQHEQDHHQLQRYPVRPAWKKIRHGQLPSRTPAQRGGLVVGRSRRLKQNGEHWAARFGMRPDTLFFGPKLRQAEFVKNFTSSEFPAGKSSLEPWLLLIFRGNVFTRCRYCVLPVRKRGAFFESQPDWMQGKKNFSPRPQVLPLPFRRSADPPRRGGLKRRHLPANLSGLRAPLLRASLLPPMSSQENPQRRHDRLQLHGQGPFERLAPGAAVFRSPRGHRVCTPSAGAPRTPSRTPAPSSAGKTQRPTGARSSPIPRSTSSTSPRPTIPTPRSPSRPPRSGKAILCEKPLALNVEQARRWSPP